VGRARAHRNFSATVLIGPIRRTRQLVEIISKQSIETDSFRTSSAIFVSENSQLELFIFHGDSEQRRWPSGPPIEKIVSHALVLWDRF
jgi:hypothetical protein